MEHGIKNDVFYSLEEKGKLCEVIKMKRVSFQRGCVLFKHSNLQHAGTGWKDSHGLRYHMYLIPGDVYCNDAVACAYGDSRKRNVQNKRKVPLSDADHLSPSYDKARAYDNTSRNAITVEMTGEGKKRYGCMVGLLD